MTKEHNHRIYIFQFGYRNPLTEWEEIIWIWKQQAKRYKRAQHITKYWLDINEQYRDYFIKIQAFELLSFLESMVTEEKVMNRAKYRLKAQADSLLELAKFEDWHNNQKLKYELLTLKNLN